MQNFIPYMVVVFFFSTTLVQEVSPCSCTIEHRGTQALDSIFNLQLGPRAADTLRDGIYAEHYPNGTILWLNAYENGMHIWGGFPAANEEYIVPLKRFHIHVEKVFVQAPFENGRLWYEGTFVQTTDSTKMIPRPMAVPVGTHQVYHRNGRLKGLVDYDKQWICAYDSLGQCHYSVSLDQHEVHEQPW